MINNWITNTNIDDFEENVILASNQQLILLDIWAEWCNPCHVLAPILEQVINHFQGKLPILGVCLGHQTIEQAFGGKIIRAKQIMHGKKTVIEGKVLDDLMLRADNFLKTMKKLVNDLIESKKEE